MKSTALVIDGNNRLYASYFAYEAFSFKGKPTSCIMGVPTMVRALVNNFKPNAVTIVWDGHKNPRRYRESLLPDYKKHRKDNTLVDLDDLIRQKLILHDLFNSLGVTQVLVEDLEGDDTLYAVVQQLKRKYDHIIINSGDKDFNQMISPNITIFSESKKKMITESNSLKEFGYKASETVDWLSLVGDKSDDIPGLPGCGKKTARLLLDKYGSISNFLDSGDEFPRVNREVLLATFKTNLRLISLKFFYRKFVRKKKKMVYVGKKYPSIKPQKFLRIANKAGVKRFIDPNFIKPFKELK
jgi:DNA polymerase I